MKPHVKFHLVFSFVMMPVMISIMTGIITVVNLGIGPGFLSSWARAFGVAYVTGGATIFLLAPLARRLTGGLLCVQP
ncbi:DUF2798 domain-containing protein [Pannonibacter indicus]|uniref:DUF2798 domain-containing protein n=1 Tax=Pannonibacter indicus TaxID=466044 RepID=UPI00391DAAAF